MSKFKPGDLIRLTEERIKQLNVTDSINLFNERKCKQGEFFASANLFARSIAEVIICDGIYSLTVWWPEFKGYNRWYESSFELANIKR